MLLTEEILADGHNVCALLKFNQDFLGLQSSRRMLHDRKVERRWVGMCEGEVEAEKKEGAQPVF